MRRTLFVVVGWVVAILTLAGQPAPAQVRGKILGPGLSSYPIAVSPLAAKEGGARGVDLGIRFADTVARDLELSGQFRNIDRSAYIEKEEPYTADTINFPNWSVIGALALVKGWHTVIGDTLTVEVRLFDVYQRRQIVGKRYTGKTAEVRRMAHRFADEIMLSLTGERGPFDSRIAFVSTRGGRFKELFVMSLDGADLKQLTSNRTINLSPSWRDTSTLVWTSFMKGFAGTVRPRS